HDDIDGKRGIQTHGNLSKAGPVSGRGALQDYRQTETHSLPLEPGQVTGLALGGQCPWVLAAKADTSPIHFGVLHAIHES
ncbi:hypothetical protein, partial [Limnohabitans sp.]|uniref:hypothetical protein n=1 Tax=Limnohabitans sp. TaxID=1907725 RepID=UPI003BB08C65